MNISEFKPILPIPSKIQREWMSREKTIFFHFGINTFSGKEWGDGTEDPAIFNPTELDCRQWIRTIKNAGFTAAILTAKHHDGFCLWPSKYTEFSIKNSPYKNGKGDIVREFTDACREYGIKAGLYVSPWDRNSKLWGTPEYDEYFINQLTELLTDYGKIYECWWDGAGSEATKYNFGRWAFTVRSLQPECALFSSGNAVVYSDCRWSGNENGLVKSPCYATVNYDDIINKNSKALAQGSSDGTVFKPAEADVSSRPGWFYHPYQDKYSKTPAQMLYIWLNSCGSNASLLYNLPPDTRGLISDIDAKNVTEFGNILKRSFAVNLINDAKISTDSIYSEKYSPYHMLFDNRDNFYASSAKTPEITFEINEKRKINCFKFSEIPEAGYRISGFEIYAKINGNFELITSGECVGYLTAEYFEEIETDEIKLKITSAKDIPLISHFGVYLLDTIPQNSKTIYEDSDNLVKNADVTVKENEYLINLGGIFPYNTIIFDGTGVEEYDLLTFNGAKWDFECSGKNPTEKEICEIRNITWSYQLKLVIKSGKLEKPSSLEVYYKKRK